MLLFVSIATAVHGGEIYRWIDEKGQAQYSDTVPKSHQQKAKAIDLDGAQVSDVQRQAAEARLAMDRARAEAMMKERAKTREIPPAPLPIPNRPGAPDKRNQCEEDWKRYTDSQACFAPYRLATGGIKAEAFQRCVEIREPARC